jgi:AraC family transcriptional regulator
MRKIQTGNNSPRQSDPAGESWTPVRDRTNQGGLLLSQQVKMWGGIQVARYRFPPGERSVDPIPGHVLRIHRSDPHYLIQRLGGRTQASTETKELVTIIPAGRAFEQVFRVESDDLNIVLPEVLIRRAAEASDVNPNGISIEDRFCANDPYIHHIGMALGAELDGDSLGEQLYAESLSYALAIHLVRKYSSQRDRINIPDAVEGLSPQVLGWATDYINENLASRLSVAEIARAANLSPFHFSRLFKISTGLSPYQYLLECRLMRARQLLQETSLPIHEIGWRTGFTDQSHLGRHIRRRYGVTPRSFR